MGQKLFDQFTYLHFAAGILMYFWNIGFIAGLILHTAFEVAENSQAGMRVINEYFTLWPGGKPEADSSQNSVGDTIGWALGWYSAKLLDQHGAAAGWYDLHLN